MPEKNICSAVIGERSSHQIQWGGFIGQSSPLYSLCFYVVFFCLLFRVVLTSPALLLQLDNALQFLSICCSNFWAPAVRFSYNDSISCHDREGPSFPVFKAIFCPLPGHFLNFLTSQIKLIIWLSSGHIRPKYEHRRPEYTTYKHTHHTPPFPFLPSEWVFKNFKLFFGISSRFFYSSGSLPSRHETHTISASFCFSLVDLCYGET